MLVRLPPGGDWRYGDRVRLEGYLYTPSENEDFSYKSYLAHQQIYTLFTCGACLTCDDRPIETCARLVERDQGSSFMSAVYALRERLVQVVYRLFPDPEAGLLAGILLGVETGISPQVLEAFRVTGTAHIIAISGFNFAVVASLFVLVFGRLLGRWRGMLAAWLGIALYAALAGASASVVRSAIMGGVSIFAIRLGRRQSGLNSLAFVAAVMALFDPMILWDVGFQLSFMATLGLVLYAEPLSGWFTGFASRWLPLVSARRLAQPVGDYLLFTLAAQVTTLPLMLVLLPAAFAGLAAGKPAGVAGPTAADGAGRAGCLAGIDLSAVGPAGGFPGLALDRLYHPDIGVPGAGAGRGAEHGTGQPVAGAGVLCAAVRCSPSGEGACGAG